MLIYFISSSTVIGWRAYYLIICILRLEYFLIKSLITENERGVFVNKMHVDVDVVFLEQEFNLATVLV